MCPSLTVPRMSARLPELTNQSQTRCNGDAGTIPAPESTRRSLLAKAGLVAGGVGVATLGRPEVALAGDGGLRFRYYVTGDRGSDSNNGITPDAGFKTMRRALAELNRLGASGEIILSDCLLRETVVIETPGLIVRGLGENLSGGTSRVQAPSPTAHCFDIRAPCVQIHNVTTLGPEGRWTGVGWRISNASQVELYSCKHRGHPRTVCDAQSGGTALMTSNGEGHYVENFRFCLCCCGVRQYTESTGLQLINTRGSNASCAALLVDGEPTGGIRVDSWKTTHCGKANGGLVALLGERTGNGVFTLFDVDESSWPARVEVRGYGYTFQGCASAPNTKYLVSGRYNGFDGFRITGTEMIVTGEKCVLDRVHNGGKLTVTGAGSRVGVVANEASHMLVLGSGVRRR
jgi:hypothetical protein